MVVVYGLIGQTTMTMNLDYSYICKCRCSIRRRILRLYCYP